MTRSRRNADDAVFEPNLIPMLDVVLQLITFFMMLVHFGTRIEGATQVVRLPVAPAALPGADLQLDRLVVVIDAEGRLVLDPDSETPRVLNVADSSGWWAEQADRRRSGLETLGGPVPTEIPTRVIIRADRSARYGEVRETLALAQERGFARFSLIVLRSQR